MAEILQKILDGKVVAIVRGIPSKDIIRTVQALNEGGIACVEVTFSLKSEEESLDALKSIRMIKNYFGNTVAVGAGTVLTGQNVYRAKEAGAKYIISPNVDKEVIRTTKELGMVSIPGAVTPTEVITAYNLGADVVKLFPAASLGLAYVNALMGPIDGIPLIAVGGIDSSNYADFIKAGCVGVGVGGNLVNKNLIGAGDFEAIKNLALEYGLKNRE